MKNLIKILLLISFLFSSSTQSIGVGMGGGILSEKIPISFIEFSAYYSPNQKTEYFGVFTNVIFGGGIGVGIKKYRNDKKGITPLHFIGTTDQHSQLQLYLEGPEDKFFSLITTNHKDHGLIMNKEILNKHNLNYLAGKKMGDLMYAEQQATLNTFIKSGLPVREIYCETINENTIGQLVIYYMIEIISLCYLINVDPFNQPAVEQVKNLTKKYLS